jgi:PPOX class probable F420-dependent enzyme
MELSDAARDFTQRASVGRLATVDASGAPHVVPICFVLLDGRIYSVIDEKPKRTTRLQRLRNLEANPRAALVIDRYSDDWSELAWVMVRGLAEIIETGARRPARDPSAARARQRLGAGRLSAVLAPSGLQCARHS